METVAILYGFTAWAMIWRYHLWHLKYGQSGYGAIAAAVVVIGMGVVAYNLQIGAAEVIALITSRAGN